MCIATAVIHAWRQVSAQEPQYHRMYVCIHIEHILWCSEGARVNFLKFIYFSWKRNWLFFPQSSEMSGMGEWGWQRSLFQEALINTMRVSRGALCRLLQPPVAKLHQSCWPVSNNPLSWGGTNIRLDIILLPIVFTSFPSLPLCFCILSFSLLFIPLQLCTPQSCSWWGGPTLWGDTAMWAEGR